MRIGCFVCTYAPYRGGIGNMAERHAAQLRRLGHDVEIICPAHDLPPGTDVVDGVVVRRLPALVRHGNSALLPSAWRWAPRYDAVYIHYPFYGAAELASLASHVRRVPYVAFFHMDVVWTGIRGRVLWAYERTLAPAILRGARRVFVSSLDYARAASIGRYGLTNLLEMPYALDLDTYFPGHVEPADLEALGVDPARRIVLFVGAMDGGHAFKGIPELLQAFAEAGLTEHAQLVLVGDGDMRPSYAASAAELLPAGAVAFPGRVAEADLVRLYRSATTTVLPSTTREEAFGVVLIEAMACGSPVIASDLPGVRAHLANGREGYLVRPGDPHHLAQALERAVVAPVAEMRDAALRAARTRFSRERERVVLGETFASL